MSTQYPTPISLAGSYDNSEPEQKRLKAINDGRSVEDYHSSPDYDRQIQRILLDTLIHKSSEPADEIRARFQHAPGHVSSGSRIRSYQITEDELAAWGYMLSNTSDSLTFLLSKESRCGQKKEHWHEAAKTMSSGVVLKDYNGDNIANSGYMIGKHNECDVVVDLPDVSERHCVIFKVISLVSQTSGVLSENSQRAKECMVHKLYLQDISGRGTFVNDKLFKRNEVVQLHDNDRISLTKSGPTWTYKKSHIEYHKSFADRFEIGRSLGRGHFAEVFEVTERTTGQRFAAKMIKKKLVADDKTFLQEIGLLMSCTHPLVTCIRDVFDVHDCIYLVLELAEGGELFDRIIQKGHFTEQETRILFKQLFGAIQYLHDHSIVHRDIKPENILLTSADSLEIRVADFGLAKIVGNTISTSTLAGTPSYIPPEMLASPNHGRQIAFSNKVDSWSAGVVLYICLCGFPPFSNELAPPSMKTQIREGRIQFQRPYWDSVSDTAIDLVQRLLTVDPEARYSVAQALQHPFITGNDSVQTSKIPPLNHSAQRGVKRQRTMLCDIGRPNIFDP